MAGKLDSVWIGWEPRELDAYVVAQHSFKKHLPVPVPIKGIILDAMRERGLYTRKHKGNVDVISDAPMATQFSISRFLTHHLAMGQHAGKGLDLYNRWALFVDCDVMVRKNLANLENVLDPAYAVMCVKHNHEPPEGLKMDGQAQLRYAKKNWSSVMAFNLAHKANRGLTVELVNTVPGRDLHGFCWLRSGEIGDLGVTYNYLVGHNTRREVADPHIVHFTEGVPSMPGYEHTDFADEYRACLNYWVAG